MRKTISLFLAMIMVVGLIPNTLVFAEEAEQPDISIQTDVNENEKLSLPDGEKTQPAEDFETTPDATPETLPQNTSTPNENGDTQPEKIPENTKNAVMNTDPAANRLSDVSLNESIKLKAGSKIKLWERLDGGNADPTNVGEYFDEKLIPYDGWQLMKLEITIPNQEGLEVTSVTPQTESLQPAYSQLTKTDSGYSYSYYFKQNGTYTFDIGYIFDGAEGHTNIEYTVSDLICIPDVTMRAYFIISMDPNEAHGYVTKSDITEGRYYYLVVVGK